MEHRVVRKKMRLDTKRLTEFLFYEHIPVNVKWDLTYLPRWKLSRKKCVRGLEDRITSIIQLYLPNEPVGIFLSGGLDSSTIAYFSKLFCKKPIETFTVAFSEPTFGEQHKAEQVAKMLGTRHHKILLTKKDFIKTAFELIPKLDIPFGDSSLIPMYYMGKVAKRHVNIVLTGDGGDELFIGYPIWRAHELLKYYRLIPGIIRRKIIIPFINNLSVSHLNENWRYRAKKFIEAEGCLNSPFYCNQTWWGAFNLRRLWELFEKDVTEKLLDIGIALKHLFDNVDFYLQQAKKGENITDKLVRQNQTRYIAGDGIKSRVVFDYTKLEIRTPLLSPILVKWVNKIPFKYKYHRGKTKIMLKELMKNRLPKEIVYGQKRGLTAPIAQWIAQSSEIKEVIFSKDDLFNHDYIQQLWDEHVSRKQNHRKLLWTLFVWKLWTQSK